MSFAREAVIRGAVRTPLGTHNGTLKCTPASKPGATAVRAVLSRSVLDPARIDSVVMGNVILAGNKMNPACQAATGGGIPVDAPAQTVNRVCGSGAQAVASAAQEVRLGHARAVIAGGIENMDTAPHMIPGGRWGHRMGPATIHDAMLTDGLNDAFSGEHSGWHTEDLVTTYGISRADQDAGALRSQQRFSTAQAAGLFAAEIVPVEVKGRKGPEMFARDAHNRPDTTRESLSQLRPAFCTGARF